MHEPDIGIYPDRRANIVRRPAAAGDVNAVLAIESQYMHWHLLEASDFAAAVVIRRTAWLLTKGFGDSKTALRAIY